MKVSIIVPVYLAQNHLSHCIDSILVQTEPDFELLLVDDGSPDQSGSLCDAYAAKDPRVRVMHKPNGGVSSARNTGLSFAKGEYVVFIDSDDYIEPAYIADLLSAAEKNPEYGNIWCAFQTVTDYYHGNCQPNFVHDSAYLTFHCDQIMSLHEMWMDASPCNKLYKTSIIQRHHLHFSEDLSLGEDWLFNLAYLDAENTKKILVITEPLYNYVQSNPESLDHQYRPDLLSIYRRLNHTCEEYLKKWNVPQEQTQIFYNSRFYLYERILSNTLHAPNLSTAEKYRWNNRFLKSAEFQSVLKQTTCYIHPLYRVSYRLGNYYFIVLLNFLQKCKKLLLRKRCPP